MPPGKINERNLEYWLEQDEDARLNLLRFKFVLIAGPGNEGYIYLGAETIDHKDLFNDFLRECDDKDSYEPRGGGFCSVKDFDPTAPVKDSYKVHLFGSSTTLGDSDIDLLEKTISEAKIRRFHYHSDYS